MVQHPRLRSAVLISGEAIGWIGSALLLIYVSRSLGPTGRRVPEGGRDLANVVAGLLVLYGIWRLGRAVRLRPWLTVPVEDYIVCMGEGVAHACLPGQTRTLCGTERLLTPTAARWPVALGQACDECLRLTSDR